MWLSRWVGVIVLIILLIVAFCSGYALVNAVSIDQYFAKESYTVNLTPTDYIYNHNDVDIVMKEECTIHCVDDHMFAYIFKHDGEQIEMELKKGFFGYYVVNVTGYVPSLKPDVTKCKVCEGS